MEGQEHSTKTNTWWSTTRIHEQQKSQALVQFIQLIGVGGVGLACDLFAVHAQHSTRDSRLRQKALARTGWQVTLYRVR